MSPLLGGELDNDQELSELEQQAQIGPDVEGGIPTEDGYEISPGIMQDIDDTGYDGDFQPEEEDEQDTQQQGPDNDRPDRDSSDKKKEEPKEEESKPEEQKPAEESPKQGDKAPSQSGEPSEQLDPNRLSPDSEDAEKYFKGNQGVGAEGAAENTATAAGEAEGVAAGEAGAVASGEAGAVAAGEAGAVAAGEAGAVAAGEAAVVGAEAAGAATTAAAAGAVATGEAAAAAGTAAAGGTVLAEAATGPVGWAIAGVTLVVINRDKIKYVVAAVIIIVALLLTMILAPTGFVLGLLIGRQGDKQGNVGINGLSTFGDSSTNPGTTYCAEMVTSLTVANGNRATNLILPAIQGKFSLEEAVTPTGHVTLNGHGAITYASMIGHGVDPKWLPYYVTARWPYTGWRWDGTSSRAGIRGTLQRSSDYGGKKIIMLNPANGKAVLGVIMESGPAPWTGVAGGKGNSQQRDLWGPNPRIDTPVGYDGRIGGGPADSTSAARIGGSQYLSTALGVKGDSTIVIGFAKPELQSATPGPITCTPNKQTQATSSNNCNGMSDLECIHWLQGKNEFTYEPQTCIGAKTDIDNPSMTPKLLHVIAFVGKAAYDNKIQLRITCIKNGHNHNKGRSLHDFWRGIDFSAHPGTPTAEWMPKFAYDHRDELSLQELFYDSRSGGQPPSRYNISKGVPIPGVPVADHVGHVHLGVKP